MRGLPKIGYFFKTDFLIDFILGNTNYFKMSNTSLVVATPPRTPVSLEAPNAPSREPSSNVTELSSIPKMQELPEKVPSTPEQTKLPLKCPGAPVREFEQRFLEAIIVSNLTVDLSNINIEESLTLDLSNIPTIENDDFATPPRNRPTKKRRVIYPFDE